MTLERPALEEPVKNTPFAAMYPDISEMFPDFKKRLSEQLRKEVVQELKKLVGDENVSDNPAVCASYGAVPFIAPEIAVRPKTVEHVQATLITANKYVIPVTPVAGGCLLSASSTFCIPRGIVLDMSGMKRIIEINTNEGYVVLEPGVTNGQLYKALEPLGYWHAKGSYNPQLSVFGPATTQVQGHRGSGGFDDIISFEVVLPDGTLVRTGGAAAKQGSWAHQYFNFPDIHGLWLNANGMLGVVTKFALRIYPKGEVATFHITGFNSTESAVRFCRYICLHGLAEHMVIWHWIALMQMEQWGKMIYGKIYEENLIPYDTWGPRNFYDPPKGVPLWLAITSFEGFKDVVDAQVRICDRIALENEGTVHTHDEIKRLFPYFYEMCVERHVRHEPPRSPAMALGLMVPFVTAAYVGLVPPRNLVQMEKHLVDLFEDKEGMSLISAYMQPFDQGRMMFHRFYISRFGATFDELREDLKKYGIYSAELLRNYGFFGHKPPAIREEGKAILEQTGGYYEVLKRIKRALDPNNIMSPHMWPGG
jgi:FAD/FMN-containing dehydrogenase